MRLTVSPTFLMRVWRRDLGSQIFGRSVKKKKVRGLRVDSWVDTNKPTWKKWKKLNDDFKGQESVDSIHISSRMISLMVTGWARAVGALGPAMLKARTRNCSLSPVVRPLTISDVLSVRPCMAGIHSSAVTRTHKCDDGAKLLLSINRSLSEPLYFVITLIRCLSLMVKMLVN